MQQICLTTALLLICGCGDDITNVYGSPAAGTGGATATVGSGGVGGDVADGGSAGLGGEPGSGGEALGGSGGAGGEGGGPCRPLTCDGIHASCGIADDGCGGYLDCTGVNDCGSSPWMECGDEGVCACNPTDATVEVFCDNNQGALEWCDLAGGCTAFYCGDPPQDMAPVGCKPFQHENFGEYVWCCRDN